MNEHLSEDRLLLLPGLAAGAITILMLMFIAHYRTYHTPLGAAAIRETPRRDALADLTAWRAKKAAEKRRWDELMRTLDTPKMVMLGKEIVEGRGLCLNCHKVGDTGTGTLGPNLDGVGARAGSRVPGMSDVAYLAQSLYEPQAYIVPGFTAAMPVVTKPPIDLSDLDVLMVTAYLQSLGSTPTVDPHTRLPYQSDGTVTARSAR